MTERRVEEGTRPGVKAQEDKAGAENGASRERLAGKKACSPERYGRDERQKGSQARQSGRRTRMKNFLEYGVYSEAAREGQVYGGTVRSRTIARRELVREVKRHVEDPAVLSYVDEMRPRFRSDCVNGPRPCPFVSCKHHLFLDVNPERGSIKLNFAEMEVWEMEETCALDIADRGGITLEEAGKLMNLTRERVRQLEVSGLNKIRARSHELSPDGDEDL